MEKELKKLSRISVKIVFRSNNKILYYKTTKGIRDVPGGHIKFGEKIIDALKRELIEEIDFKLVVDPTLLYAWTYLSNDKNRHEVYIGYLLYLPKQLSFKSVEYPDKIQYIWVNKEEIINLKFLPEMGKLLLKALEYKK